VLFGVIAHVQSLQAIIREKGLVEGLQFLLGDLLEGFYSLLLAVKLVSESTYLTPHSSGFVSLVLIFQNHVDHHSIDYLFEGNVTQSVYLCVHGF